MDYASIPWEAPVPCRYLFCHGNGRGPEKLQVGMVPSLPRGAGRRGEGPSLNAMFPVSDSGRILSDLEDKAGG